MRVPLRLKGAQSSAVLFALAVFGIAIADKANAIAGLEGTFEFGLDAPWRIEPNKRADGALEYGAIPLQITIHGAMDAPSDDLMYSIEPQGAVLKRITTSLPKNLVSLGKIQSIRVRDLNSGAPFVDFPLSALHEIERTTGAWPWPARSRPTHELCRVWAGENPEPFRDVSASSEWHATLWFKPKNPSPGTYVTLQIEVILKRDPWSRANLPTRGLLSAPGSWVDTTEKITLRNYVRVYLAPAPMPRFDNRWVYGDFHYHSQGTDNEGEAGYNYRGVLRAMGAMGLDFVFATEHASNSEQVVDADLPPIWDIARIANSQDEKLKESNVRWRGMVARDMNADRFVFAHDLIYGERGANKEAAIIGPKVTPSSLPAIVGVGPSSEAIGRGGYRRPQNLLSYGVVPQLFLGGELDAIPEIKASTVRDNTSQTEDNKPTVVLPFGNGLQVDISKLCDPMGCDNPVQTLLKIADADSYVVRDFQSLESFSFYGREHLVYFPSTSRILAAGGGTTFIPSNTSRFGGATRRLVGQIDGEQSLGSPLLPEIERKGFAFVAHHLNSGSGRGPDGIPWTTDHMLLKAFRSPAILGLEFWNEDSRNSESICSHYFCKGERGRQNGFYYLGHEEGYEREEDLVADGSNWLEDLVVKFGKLFGHNWIPEEFRNIALPLEEVRHGFVTGGARGSLFELYAFSPATGRWGNRKDTTVSPLFHGAYDWDMMNLRGLDFEGDARLPWLGARQPRRMYMGGGSDAHGDLNYRRGGYFMGTEDSNDTAIGKPRNLVFAGSPEGDVVYRDSERGEIRAHSQEQIVRALKSGRFSVTDGPAIRIAIDRNNNGVIDDGDVQMGDVFTLADNGALVTIPDHAPVGGALSNDAATVTLLTEVVSTQEFGSVASIDVYVGVHPEPTTLQGVTPRIYAARGHGPAGPASNRPGYTSNGHNYFQRTDNYWAGEELGDVSWYPAQGAAPSYTKTFVTRLNLNRYEVGQGLPANRFFVRAFTQTTQGNYLPLRYGYSNPIWIVREPVPVVITPSPGSSPTEPPVSPPPSPTRAQCTKQCTDRFARCPTIMTARQCMTARRSCLARCQ